MIARDGQNHLKSVISKLKSNRLKSLILRLKSLRHNGFKIKSITSHLFKMISNFTYLTTSGYILFNVSFGERLA